MLKGLVATGTVLPLYFRMTTYDPTTVPRREQAAYSVLPDAAPAVHVLLTISGAVAFARISIVRSGMSGVSASFTWLSHSRLPNWSANPTVTSNDTPYARDIWPGVNTNLAGDAGPGCSVTL